MAEWWHGHIGVGGDTSCQSHAGHTSWAESDKTWQTPPGQRVTAAGMRRRPVGTWVAPGRDGRITLNRPGACQCGAGPNMRHLAANGEHANETRNNVL